MTAVKVKAGTGDWIVVCDGRKALILENKGDQLYPDLRTREVLEQESPPTREQGADEPGRMQHSVGEVRSSVEQTDWHDRDEQVFLTKLAALLDAAVQAGETKSIVIVAPPRALGKIRPEYSIALKRAVSTEVPKDLVNQPVHEIEKQLLR